LHEVRVGVELIADDPQLEDREVDRTADDPQHSPSAPGRNAAPSTPRSRQDGIVPDPEASVGPSERGLRLRPLTRRQIAALPTAAERATFRLLHTLAGPDGDRLPRELGWTFMQRQLANVDLGAADPWNEPLPAGIDDALGELVPDLLRKPVRNALRELPIVRDIELQIEDFKIHNVPTSGAWLDSRDEDRRRYGHVSLRLQGRGSDPLSVTYAVHGWRLGASRDTVRAGYSALLGDGLWLTIGSTFDHVAERYDAMAELKFDISARTRLLCTFGNQINLFPGATLDRMARKDLDGGTGAMVYVETIF
jgi:hypothetical protein